MSLYSFTIFSHANLNGPPPHINTHVVALIAYSYFTFFLYFFATSFSCASPYQPKLDYYQVCNKYKHSCSLIPSVNL